MSEFNEILFEEPNLNIDTIISDQNSINLNYEKLKQDLHTVKDKNKIYCIDKSNYSLTKLERNIFDEFYELIDLNLSHNLLTNLPTGVFDQLLNLQLINLSHNLISVLEDSMFKNNTQLRIINFSNNLINEINSNKFHDLPILQKLNFSYNEIVSLSKGCVVSESLMEFNLNNNLINDINSMAFWFVPNLLNLQLNNNKISVLYDTMFRNTTKIEYLNFSYNMIQKLDKKTFANLNNLKQVDFSNNLLSTCGNCFENKPMLTELNLLNNQLKNFRKIDFGLSKNIRKLKLTIHKPHKLEQLNKLQLLSDFELHVKTDTNFSLNNHVLHLINVPTIQRLHMVIQKGIFNVTHEISKFFNLEFLHIEFLKPSCHEAKFNIGYHMNQMSKLQHLALININKLTVIRDSYIKQNNLTYLNLTGIENMSADFLRNNFEMLEYLYLSESQISYIFRNLLSTLPSLKYLIMNNTKITGIGDNIFQFNNNLEVIDFKNCEIHSIGENAFRNLVNLKEIDIRGNIKLRITQNLLNGIPKSAVVFYD